MPVSPLPQSPHRQDRKVFPTPLIGDVLFSEVRDCNRITIPEYGTPHPDTAKWPDHKLVYVKPVDIERNEIFEFFYAADRENQDLYNFEFRDVDLGGQNGNRYPAVVRSYVTLRENWVQDNTPSGTEMVNIPADKFSGVYVQSSNEQARIGEPELDSLFVIEKKTFIKRSTLGEVKLDPATGRSKRSVTDLYYRGELVSDTAIEELAANPSGSYWGLQPDGVFRELDQLTGDWFAVIESSTLPANATNSAPNAAKIRIENRVTPLGTDILFSETGAMPDPVPEYGSPHYNMANHKLALIEPADASGLLFKFTYVADRENQDDYNFEYTDADIGGQKFQAVVRTYITPRTSWTPDGSNNGDAMTTSVGLSGNFVQSSYAQTRIGEPALDSIYIVEKKTYIRKVPMYQNDYDEVFGGNLQTVQNLYFRGEFVPLGGEVSELFSNRSGNYWGLSSSGSDVISREGIQLTEDWFAITEKQVLPIGFESDSSSKSRTYTTSIEFAWPAVLGPDIRWDVWPRRDGGNEYNWWIKYKKEAFRGPCKAVITESFTINKPSSVDVPLTLKPEPISISNPFWSINIGPTLHPAMNFYMNTGTTDRTYKYIVTNYNYGATNYVDWPESIVASDEVRPFRGGWMQTKTVVYSPT